MRIGFLNKRESTAARKRKAGFINLLPDDPVEDENVDKDPIDPPAVPGDGDATPIDGDEDAPPVGDGAPALPTEPPAVPAPAAPANGESPTSPREGGAVSGCAQTGPSTSWLGLLVLGAFGLRRRRRRAG